MEHREEGVLFDLTGSRAGGQASAAAGHCPADSSELDSAPGAGGPDHDPNGPHLLSRAVIEKEEVMGLFGNGDGEGDASTDLSQKECTRGVGLALSVGSGVDQGYQEGTVALHDHRNHSPLGDVPQPDCLGFSGGNLEIQGYWPLSSSGREPREDQKGG